MGTAEFVEAVQDSSVIVIDVRTPAEYAAGHFEGALSIDAESGTFDAEIAELDTSKTYALYYRSGRRAQLAADVMVNAGFGELHVLAEGGFDDLSAAGVPVARG